MPPGRGSVVGRKFLAPPYYSQRTVFASLWALFYAALLPRRGPHIASHSVCPSVCPSVQLSLPSVTSFRQPLASRMYFLARTEGIRTFRHALRAAYRTAISAAQILVSFQMQSFRSCIVGCFVLVSCRRTTVLVVLWYQTVLWTTLYWSRQKWYRNVAVILWYRPTVTSPAPLDGRIR